MAVDTAMPMDLLEQLRSIDGATLDVLSREADALEALQEQAGQIAAWGRVKRHFPYFLFKYVITFDSQDTVNPEKPFPRMRYLGVLSRLLQSETRLLIPKSRQMMVSWIVCDYCLWVAMTGPHREVYIQSKKQEDAAQILNRCKFSYCQLPPWMRAYAPVSKPAMEQADTHLKFDSGSTIFAIPEGDTHIRSRVPTLLFSDEMAFQPEAETAWGAAQPAMKRGSQFVGVSTANGKEFFCLSIFDNNVGQLTSIGDDRED